MLGAKRAAQTLEAVGYRVQLASNGRDALVQARRWHPDVILSDVLMPVMDGFALCRELRRDPAERGEILVSELGSARAAVGQLPAGLRRRGRR